MDQSRLNFFKKFSSHKKPNNNFYFICFNKCEYLGEVVENDFIFINDFDLKIKFKKSKLKRTIFNIKLKKIFLNNKSKSINILSF